MLTTLIAALAFSALPAAPPDVGASARMDALVSAQFDAGGRNVVLVFRSETYRANWAVDVDLLRVDGYPLGQSVPRPDSIITMDNTMGAVITKKWICARDGTEVIVSVACDKYQTMANCYNAFRLLFNIAYQDCPPPLPGGIR